ncbi:MAG: demethoxyubiquinone hydroxylase family protein [Pseudomonadota bacterium]
MPSDTPRPLPDLPSDQRIVADLRTDHAGETGAVWIYKGILAVSKDGDVRLFAKEHMATEQKHLALIEGILPPGQRSKLVSVWKLAGFLTGALPALFGPRAVFKTIEAVETFVDHHYQEQIEYLDQKLEAEPTLGDLKQVLVDCQADEVAHRDDAAGRDPTPAGPLMSVWTRLVGAGSKGAVSIARFV